MESIAYLHIASAYEESENLEFPSIRANFNLFESWQTISTPVAIRLLSATLALAIISVAGQAMAARPGVSGTEVSNIQRCLKRLGYFEGSVTGNFGSKTENAVRKFQRAKGLPAIGVVGPQTQRALDTQCGTARRSQPRNVPRRPTRNPNSIPPAPAPRFEFEMRLGSNGPDVSRLQRDLQTLGLYYGPINGNFDFDTENAVRLFQRNNSLNPDGVVGTRTRQSIIVAVDTQRPQPGEPIGQSYPTILSQGSSGPEVTSLQQLLQRLGYFTGNPTGNFGSATRDSVIRFQQEYGLYADGVVNNQTWDALIRQAQQGPSNPPGGRAALLRPGDNNENVRNLQLRLEQLGYFKGNPNGFYGDYTRDAVTQFQRNYRLNVTGFVDSATWQALGLRNIAGVGGEIDNPIPTKRYVVVVPIQNRDTLRLVRQHVGNAFEAESNLGRYINAGQFEKRQDAERLIRNLQDRGFDARVDFF
jgi:peptidoglycan hydrolase-like protein with peptidoglycan-binding domain